jgi:hypothetical protein
VNFDKRPDNDLRYERLWESLGDNRWMVAALRAKSRYGSDVYEGMTTALNYLDEKIIEHGEDAQCVQVLYHCENLYRFVAGPGADAVSVH